MTPTEIALELEGVISDIQNGRANGGCVKTLRRIQELALNPWQPIETAPRDGSRLLLFVPPYGPSTGHFCATSQRWYCHSVLNKDADSTHWMPLPEPPMEKKDEN